MSTAMQSTQCQALLTIVGMDICRRNPFRLLGLGVNARNRRIRRQEKELIAAHACDELEEEYAQGLRPDPLPSREEISQAARELADPQKRIIYEFFWFWSVDGDTAATDPCLDALAAGDVSGAQRHWRQLAEAADGRTALVAKHNLAVLGHFAALEWEIALVTGKAELTEDYEREANRYWKLAFSHWEGLCKSADFWTLMEDRVEAVGDPRLTGAFVRDFADSLPIALDNVNADLAVAFCEREMYGRASQHVRFMKETNEGDDDIDASMRRVTVPLQKRIDNAIDEATNQLPANKEAGRERCIELFNTVQNTVRVLQVLLGDDSSQFMETADRVALGMLHCQVAYGSETEDWVGSLPLLEDALKIARGREAREMIEENIRIVKNNSKREVCWFCSTNKRDNDASFEVELQKTIYWRDVRRDPEKYAQAVQAVLKQVVEALSSNPSAMMNSGMDIVGLMSPSLASKAQALSQFVEDHVEIMTQTSTTTVPRCAVCAGRHTRRRSAEDNGSPPPSATKPLSHYRQWTGVLEAQSDGLAIMKVDGKSPSVFGASAPASGIGWAMVLVAMLLTFPIFPYSGWVAFFLLCMAINITEDTESKQLTGAGNLAVILILVNVVRGIVHVVN